MKSSVFCFSLQSLIQDLELENKKLESERSSAQMTLTREQERAQQLVSTIQNIEMDQQLTKEENQKEQQGLRNQVSERLNIVKGIYQEGQSSVLGQ